MPNRKHALQRLDLNHLVTLEALLSETSLARTAERLAITQTMLRQALDSLQKHFGDSLIVQKGPTLVRTPFAEELLPPLSEALLQLRQLVQTVRRVDQEAAL